MEQVEYRITRKTFAMQVGLCIVLALGGSWLAWTAKSLMATAFGSAFALGFAICCVKVILERRHSRPRVILSDAGLYDKALGTTTIPWKSVLAAKTVLFFGSVFLMLLLEDEADRIRRFSLIRRYGVFSNWWFGLSPFTINPNGLDAPCSQVLLAIQERLLSAGLKRDPSLAEEPHQE